MFPDGGEYVGESRPDGLQWVCDEAVRKKGISSPRKAPAKVPVEVFRLTARDGKLVRTKEATVQAQPCLERMTEAEYDEELAEALSGIPVEFRSFVSGHAWDQGHAYGYEEVVRHAKDLVERLSPCVEAHARRDKAQK